MYSSTSVSQMTSQTFGTMRLTVHGDNLKQPPSVQYESPDARNLKYLKSTKLKLFVQSGVYDLYLALY